MVTGETIKGLFSQEMSSIPQGCRRRRRRRRKGLENGALGRPAGQRIVLADMCRYRCALMAAPKPGELISS